MNQVLLVFIIEYFCIFFLFFRSIRTCVLDGAAVPVTLLLISFRSAKKKKKKNDLSAVGCLAVGHTNECDDSDDSVRN